MGNSKKLAKTAALSNILAAFGFEMDSYTLAGDESVKRSQPLTAPLELAPVLSRAKLRLPAICAAEETLAHAILNGSNGLSSSEQHTLLAAAGQQWPVPVRSAANDHVVEDPTPNDSVLGRFGRQLARYGPWCSKDDCDALVASGYRASSIVAAVATVALGQFRCTLAAGLLDLPWLESNYVEAGDSNQAPAWKETASPFLAPANVDVDLEQPYATLRALFGFIPNLIRVQSLLPRLASAQVELLDTVLSPEDYLSQTQKHGIALSLAAANCNTYMVTLHGEILSLLGVDALETQAILDNVEQASIADGDKLFYRESRKLGLLPGTVRAPLNRGALRNAGFTELQVGEGVVAAALTNFLCTIQFGLGAVPDFQPLRAFHVKDLYLSSAETRPTQNSISPQDPDIEQVSRVKAGETEVFENLVRCHTGRIFRTLCGMLGNAEEARDATQDTFLKAFEHIDKFEARSRFSTWLMSIAINTGTELLRRRRPIESLDESEDEKGFRPRQVQSWVDDPEQALAKSQVNALVRKGVLRLPEKYRVALLLRDLNQLSTEDTAEALGLSIPATKARLLRGRLMLRESLAPHFSRAGGDHHV
jgi:RNA polymerase sigma-70 factor (ECF subfamily)